MTHDSIPAVKGTPVSRFEIGEHDFLLDGAPVRILSGALHYFRVHPDHWRDRIRKARLMGLNTIETYIPWNAHAPHEDEFRLDGQLDLGRFLDDIAAEGLHAIVRPGPYICAEWDNGGLPAWLYRKEGVGIRRNEPQYLDAIRRYFDHLAPVLAPRQVDTGGPIILVQIENEYGAFGSDKEYLQELVDINRAIGLTVPFTTVDQPTDEMLQNGSLPSLHKTGSFGSKATERLATLRANQPTGPLMSSEFWNGWFDYWGSNHHTTPMPVTAQELDDVLATGASVNLYMFHGGASFGFTNGANDKGTYLPTVTSYDYDAPLDESGEPREKYWAFRDVIAKYAPVPDERPTAAPTAPDHDVDVIAVLPLAEAVDTHQDGSAHDEPPTLDALAHYRGFGLYEVDIDIDRPAVLRFSEVRDRAQLFLDWTPIGGVARDHHDTGISIPGPFRGTLRVLLEDQGRVNYGIRLGEVKGLIGPVTLAGEALLGWRAAGLPLDDVEPIVRRLRAVEVPPGTVDVAGPAFALAVFDLPDLEDVEPEEYPVTYLVTTELGKGVAWLNGFNLGRYWSRGPQATLLVPSPLLRVRGNELVLFEQQAISGPITFSSEPRLGHLEV